MAYPAAAEAIDREKVCPCLLRVFYRVGNTLRPDDFAKRGEEPKEEITVYTWPDATLKEIAELVREVVPAARNKRARLAFTLVYPDKRGKAVMRALGDVHGSRRTADDSKTLRTLKFEIGDFLAVSIYS